MKMPFVKELPATWQRWCDEEYPFDPKWESILLHRTTEQRAPVGHPTELNDLRGIRDRELAAMLAPLWANANRIAADQIRRGMPVDTVDRIPPAPDYGYEPIFAYKDD
jgi:hypothetical protein